MQFGEYSCNVETCSRFGYRTDRRRFSGVKEQHLYHGTDKISEVRNVPHTHPVFNQVSPTTHSSNASVSRGDTKRGTSLPFECTAAQLYSKMQQSVEFLGS